MKARPLAGLRADAHRAADFPYHGLHHIQSHAPSRVLRHGPGRRETGKEQKLQQLCLGHALGEIGRRQAPFDHLGSKALQIDALAIIRDGNDECSSPVAGFHAHQAGLRLTGGLPLSGRLDAMVHRIA